MKFEELVRLSECDCETHVLPLSFRGYQQISEENQEYSDCWRSLLGDDVILVLQRLKSQASYSYLLSTVLGISIVSQRDTSNLSQITLC